MNLSFLWLIPLLPFLGALVNGVFGRRLGRAGVHAVALGASGLSCILSLLSVFALMGKPASERFFSVELSGFLPFGAALGPNELLHWGFSLDPLSAVMISFVTFVGFLIHVYSTGYMAHEESYARFFSYLNLFMGSMLTLILGNSLPVMFVGWEGVGFCSYLLIGFHYNRNFDTETGLTCADAGRKAFLTNRIGDFFFVCGMLIAFTQFGTLSFTGLQQQLHAVPTTAPVLIAICLFMFAGATAKSAQIPLYVWLPDAMAGPTPVSALIHAATMVTAGIYMLCRMYFMFALVPQVLAVVAVIAVLTALFAALMGTAATDIKKVLAYSTVSQLGYMFIGVGVGAPASGLFHVFTHAFFKALLFLGAGSVIHALSGEQDIRRMGQLFKKLPITAWTFLIGVLAIAGTPFFSGFFSKDAILHHAFTTELFEQAGLPWLRLPVYLLALTTAGLTSFYMFRLLFLVFFNEDRTTTEAKAHLHESPRSMTLPLVVLATFAVVAGYLSPGFGAKDHWGDFLGPVFNLHAHGSEHAAGFWNEWTLAALSILLALAGFALAWRNYFRPSPAPAAFVAARPGLYALLRGKFFVDEIYEAFFLAPVRKLAAVVDSFDRWVVDGLVNAMAFSQEVIGCLFRFLQTGVVRDYGVIFALSATGILLWAVLKV